MRKLRKERGMSQEEAAYRAEMSVTRWKTIEKGKENEDITIETLWHIADALGVPEMALELTEVSFEEIQARINGAGCAEGKGGDVFRIGGNIVHRRRAQGLTQKHLASMANVSVARLRDIEHECANAKIGTLRRIAQAFNISLLALCMAEAV